MILSDTSKQYLQEEDAVKGFRAAVENGQSRLALQILTDIVDAFMEIFQEALENPDDETAAAQQAAKESVSVPAVESQTSDHADSAAEPAKPKAVQKKETKASE